MRATLPRTHEVLAAHDPDGGVIHTLVVSLVAADAPKNRAAMRSEIRRMPRRSRRSFGYGWDRRAALIGFEPGWADATGRDRTEPKKVAR